MNLIQLGYASLVAKHGSFSAAARAADAAQPTVSNAISDLEAELGGKLFRRTTRRVELTAFGRELLQHINDVLNAAEILQRHAHTLLRPERKLLRVAFSPLIDSRRVIALFEPFRQSRTDVEIVYKECSVSDMESRLDQEQIDIICGVHLRADTGRGRCVLYRDPLRFLARGGTAQHRGQRHITLRDIARETLVLTAGSCGLAPATLDLFRASRLKVQAYPGQALSYQVLQEWSDLGIGAAILPESRIAGDAGAYPLVLAGETPVALAYEAVWSKSALHFPHIKDVTRYLKTAAAALTRGGAWRSPAKN
ncbi:MAG: LysR family transcriptional regulator [Gammaproteobacteria bacterium]|nr:LysR family transcriptional regulator [Gammaproteobacteria bacterium]